MSEPLHYLRILARVRADNTVRRVRTQLSETPSRFDAEAHPRIAWTELYAADGQLLLRWPVAGGPECVLERERHRMSDLLMRSHIPLPVGARKLRLVRDGIVLTEIKIAPEPPAAELNWPPEGLHRVTGRHAVSWRSDAASVEAFLRYSTDDGRSWLRIGGRSTAAPFQVDFDELPESPRCRLALVVTADCRSATVVSPSFQVPEKSAHMVTVVSPAEGAVLQAGVPVLLESAVAQLLGSPDAERERAIDWHSDRDGELGTGPTLSTILTPGEHRLSASVSGESLSSTVVTVLVINPDFSLV